MILQLVIHWIIDNIESIDVETLMDRIIEAIDRFLTTGNSDRLISHIRDIMQLREEGEHGGMSYSVDDTMAFFSRIGTQDDFVEITTMKDNKLNIYSNRGVINYEMVDRHWKIIECSVIRRDGRIYYQKNGTRGFSCIVRDRENKGPQFSFGSNGRARYVYSIEDMMKMDTNLSHVRISDDTIQLLGDQEICDFFYREVDRRKEEFISLVNRYKKQEMIDEESSSLSDTMSSEIDDRLKINDKNEEENQVKITPRMNKTILLDEAIRLIKDDPRARFNLQSKI